MLTTYRTGLNWLDSRGGGDIFLSHFVEDKLSSLEKSEQFSSAPLFPNPSNSSYRFKNPSGYFKYTVYNALGVCISQSSLVDERIVIPDAGWYIVELTSKDGTISRIKVLKR
jgi:hypothetical protein